MSQLRHAASDTLAAISYCREVRQAQQLQLRATDYQFGITHAWVSSFLRSWASATRLSYLLTRSSAEADR